MASSLLTAQNEFSAGSLSAAAAAAGVSPASLLALEGLSAETVSLPATRTTITHFTTGNALAGVRFTSDGRIVSVRGAAEDVIGGTTQWIDNQVAGIGSNYYITVSWTSGGVLGATTSGNTISIVSDRYWRVEQTTVGTDSTILTVKISDDSAGNNVLAQAEYELIATKDSLS